MLTLDEGPGVLFKALAVFAVRDINLTKVICGKKKILLVSLALHDDFQKINVYFEIRLKAARKEIGHYELLMTLTLELPSELSLCLFIS